MNHSANRQVEGSRQREPVQAAARELSPVAAGYFCPGCGYELQGLTGDRCPECGESIDAVRAEAPTIPWERRTELGWFAAYWQTRDLIRFHRRSFWNAAARDVDYRSARLFQLVSVAVATLPMAIATAVVYFLGTLKFTQSTTNPLQFAAGPFSPSGFEADVRELGEAGWPLGIGVGLIFLCLLAWTGLPSYFFHPRTLPVIQQNRGVALSYYAGSSAMMWLGVPWAGAAMLLDGSAAALAVLCATGVSVILIAFTLADLFGVARRTMQQYPGRRAAMVLLLPLLWAIAGGVILLGIPALLAGVYVVFASLG